MHVVKTVLIVLAWLLFALLLSGATKWGLKVAGLSYPQNRSVLNFAGQGSFLFFAAAPIIWRWWRLYRQLLP